jgi:TetR/AcrR family transcriptional repressor of lmrAB and yxaGH operons
MSDARSKIVETTSRLLEEQGYHATGLSQIVEESGAPKGSLYYYFPDGKEEISEAALRRTGERVESNIRKVLSSAPSAAEGVKSLMNTIGQRIEASGYRAGGPITTVALESAPETTRLTRACQQIYDRWHAAIRERIREDGVEERRADRLAGTVLASIEGAMVLARTQQSRTPLDDAATSLAEMIDGASG